MIFDTQFILVPSEDNVGSHSTYHVQYVDSDLYTATGQAQSQMYVYATLIHLFKYILKYHKLMPFSGLIQYMPLEIMHQMDNNTIQQRRVATQIQITHQDLQPTILYQ